MLMKTLSKVIKQKGYFLSNFPWKRDMLIRPFYIYTDILSSHKINKPCVVLKFSFSLQLIYKAPFRFLLCCFVFFNGQVLKEFFFFFLGFCCLGLSKNSVSKTPCNQIRET